MRRDMPVARSLPKPRIALPTVLLAAAALAAATPLSRPALSQPAPVTLELNRLEAQSQGCRVWMLARNPGAPVDPLRLDLVVFGRDGVVSRRLALDLGPLPAEKTMARIFDLAGTPCDGVGHLLLNDVLACGPDAPAACLSRLTVSSRAQGVALEK